jgi:hypothetical protein
VDPTGDGHESQCDPQRLDGERVGLDPQLLGILIKWIAKNIDLINSYLQNGLGDFHQRFSKHKFR